MNIIRLNEKGFIDDKWQYSILVDKEEVLNMEVSIKNSVATVTYNGKMSLFKGFTGALLLNELLGFTLDVINGANVAKTYFDDGEYGLSNYCDQFKYETERLENGITCYYIKK